MFTRPKKETEENKAQLKLEKQQRHKDYTQRIPIEGKFGQGKNGYGLNKIKAKTARTSYAWINSIFFVMNLLALSRVFHLPGVIQRLFELTWALTCKNGVKWFGRVDYPPVNCTTGDCGEWLFEEALSNRMGSHALRGKQSSWAIWLGDK